MTRPTSVLHTTLANPYVAYFGSVTSIAAFLWFIFEKIHAYRAEGSLPVASQLQFAILILSALIVLLIGFYSFRVRQENRAFRNTAEKLHSINHDYRDVLCAMFRGNEPVNDRTELAKQELLALESVCQRAAKIYNSFTHGDCTVTVKLITKADKRLFAETYVRSENKCPRDQWEPKAFAIGVGQNSAFDKAIQISPGRISHFFSADLTKEKDYRNQRDNWNRFYRGAILVPIRYVNPAKVGSPEASDDIGFLSVDTMSPNRLNDSYHLQYLAALADQMYNFMSLMRGKYSVEAANKKAGVA